MNQDVGMPSPGKTLLWRVHGLSELWCNPIRWVSDVNILHVTDIVTSQPGWSWVLVGVEDILVSCSNHHKRVSGYGSYTLGVSCVLHINFHGGC
jgi:hypothetical protein